MYDSVSDKKDTEKALRNSIELAEAAADVTRNLWILWEVEFKGLRSDPQTTDFKFSLRVNFHEFRSEYQSKWQNKSLTHHYDKRLSDAEILAYVRSDAEYLLNAIEDRIRKN